MFLILRRHMRHKLSVLVICSSLAATDVWAQAELVTTPPSNLILGNYNSTSVGPYGGLEGAAYVARIGDPSAAWFNPAGLTREDAAQISGSAGVYQRTLVTPRALPNRGGSIQQLPNYVGFTFVPREGLTVGAAVMNTNAWDQETDAQLITPVAGGQQRFAYSADSGFEQRVAAIGVGYDQAGRWRLGAGFAFSLMNLRLAQSASDRIADASGLRTLVVSASASGSAMQFRAQGGVQYDAGRWRFGGAVRSPGLTLYRTGHVMLDSALAEQPESVGASIFDVDARLEYHAPWEFQGGVAFVGPRVELEFDIQAYTPIDAYQLLSSDQPVLLYADAGSNAPPVVSSRSFVGLTSASDGVVNVAAGGHVRLMKDRDLRLHAGIGSNRSPVAPADVVFNEVDLTTWSVGVSGTLGRFQFSFGLNRQSGGAEDVMLRHLLSGQAVRTPIDVRLTGFIYSLAYQF
jgi:hypothetical protein